MLYDKTSVRELWGKYASWGISAHFAFYGASEEDRRCKPSDKVYERYEIAPGSKLNLIGRTKLSNWAVVFGEALRSTEAKLSDQLTLYPGFV